MRNSTLPALVIIDEPTELSKIVLRTLERETASTSSDVFMDCLFNFLGPNIQVQVHPTSWKGQAFQAQPIVKIYIFNFVLNMSVQAGLNAYNGPNLAHLTIVPENMFVL